MSQRSNRAYTYVQVYLVKIAWHIVSENRTTSGSSAPLYYEYNSFDVKQVSWRQATPDGSLIGLLKLKI